MIFRRFLSVILTLALLLSLGAPAYAAADTEYLQDIRIVYGKDLEDAQKKLAGSAFSDYKLFPFNLNEGTEAYIGFVGFGEEPHVYIAYQTTTNVEEAITDVAVMDMNGGYSEGNLQAMLEKSLAEYEVYAEYYIQAFDYFRQAYVDGDRLADAAYRQLNLYVDPDSGERMGDLLLNDVSKEALAIILLQGNLNILDNMRALVAMGVTSFGSDLSYLEKVEVAAAQMDEDSAVFADENWYELSLKISGTFSVLKDMVYDYEAVEDTLDYTDEDFTEDEINYMEYANITNLLRNTTYLGGQTLADFVCTYQETDDSYLQVYPLIAAMNGGQKALSELCLFYNVLRYSTTELSVEAMETQIAELEATHVDGIDIYIGVDRELYDGTFAVTSAADRAAASAGRDVVSDVFGRGNYLATYIISGVAFVGNIGLLLYNIANASSGTVYTAAEIANRAADAFKTYFNEPKILLRISEETSEWVSGTRALEVLSQKYNVALDPAQSLSDQTAAFLAAIKTKNTAADSMSIMHMQSRYDLSMNHSNNIQRAAEAANNSSGLSLAATWTIFSGVMLAIAAVNGGIWIHHYLNPELTDIPLAMVDVRSDDNGDRYLYYDVVQSIDGHAADTNAFEGQAWNALYVCRSYEAGNALLADFDISYDSNQPADDYISIHKFGDSVSFDLNKHAFGDELQIYLSVALSEDQKSGATDIPDVVGTVLSIGSYFLAAGLGIAAGIGIMIGVQRSKKKEAQEA